MAERLTRSLRRNLQALGEALALEQNDDFVLRRFRSMDLDCAIVYIDGMSSAELMARDVLSPMMACAQTAAGDRALKLALDSLIAVTESLTTHDIGEIVETVMSGQCAILLDTADSAIVLDVRSYAKRGVGKPVVESVVMGPHEAFDESLRDNLTLLHRMVHSPLLICQSRSIGTVVPTQAALCYLNGVCPQATVDELSRRLDGCAADHVLSIGMLEQLLEDDPHAPLPQVALTERPDRAVSFLMEGQAVVLLDGSPFALTMPVSLWHLFHASDDTGMRWQYGTFLRVLRLIGAAFALLLPALFLALVLFRPGALPMTMLTSIMESRTVVPISLFGEAILMLVMFNLINEASTRVPGLMGSSLGLVSALILGSAAVDASLVSPLLIIIVALSGLGSYAIPDYATSMAFRILQFALVVAAGLMGLAGIAAVLGLCVCRVAGMTSLGRPYLAPTNPHRPHNPDLIVRAPIYRQRLRAYLSNPAQMLRAKGRMRRR